MKIYNALSFNVIWLTSVFYGNALIFVSIFLLLVHFLLVDNLQYEFRTVGVIATCGIAVDSLLTLFGVYSFDVSQVSFLGLPLWLIVLWLGFSVTINHSFSFVSKSLLFQLIMGFILLPLNYFYGYKLNAVNFNYSVIHTLSILAIVWGVSVPLLFHYVHIVQKKLTLKSLNNE